MRTFGIVIGVFLGLSGIVWTLQGMGSALAPQSFMTDAKEWIAIGTVTATGGIALAVWSARRPR
jgi:hypothetical protein